MPRTSTRLPRKGNFGTPLPKARDVDQIEVPKLVPLNFKVPGGFHREFKTFAAMRGLSMVELLREGFRLVKDHARDSPDKN